MAPIPVYSNSPIAAKPDGVTPKTAAPEASSSSASPTRTRPAQPAYPAAQPGAVPSLPQPTGSAYRAPVELLPTPTSRVEDAPPAPQPGASIPPPPKAGEKYHPPVQTPAPHPTMPLPQQMSVPSPSAPLQQRGTSTAPASSTPYGTQLPFGVASGSQGTENLQHPPGYHQNANTSELGRFQQSSAEQHGYEDSRDGLESVWGAAKKFAQQTGERLAATENEIWKKLNKE